MASPTEFNRAFTAEQAVKAGIAPWSLERMAAAGKVWRIARGIYLPKGECPDGRTFAAEVALRFPGAVVCLRSAAEMHALTTEVRDTVHLAMPTAFRPVPRSLGNPDDGIREVRWSRWSPEMMTCGVSSVCVHGVNVPITSAARTVVDYFKYSRDNVNADAGDTGIPDTSPDGASGGFGKPVKGVFFGYDEALSVLDLFMAGREYDPELSDLARKFGVARRIEPLLEGRRSLTTRRM